MELKNKAERLVEIYDHIRERNDTNISTVINEAYDDGIYDDGIYDVDNLVCTLQDMIKKGLITLTAAVEWVFAHHADERDFACMVIIELLP